MQKVKFNKPFRFRLEGGDIAIYPANRVMEVSETVVSEAKRTGFIDEPRSTKAK